MFDIGCEPKVYIYTSALKRMSIFIYRNNNPGEARMLNLDESKKMLINAIGNESRLKILLVLWKSDQELTVYKISRFTGLGRSSVVRHIHNLVKSGLVSRKIYGEIPLYMIDNDNPKVNALIDFFQRAKL
jgi:DNA-binding transcriptional ArsR family regulator